MPRKVHCEDLSVMSLSFTGGQMTPGLKEGSSKLESSSILRAARIGADIARVLARRQVDRDLERMEPNVSEPLITENTLRSIE